MMCMQHVPTIAIVGRPNVGKSAIFNRMAGRRIAIVHDEPGVTRDRLSAPCKITDRACKIMDTGGIGARLSDGFAEQVEAEADIAIKRRTSSSSCWTAGITLHLSTRASRTTSANRTFPSSSFLTKPTTKNRILIWANLPDWVLTTISFFPPPTAEAFPN